MPENDRSDNPPKRFGDLTTDEERAAYLADARPVARANVNRCPYCDYVTPERLDGDAYARGWQEFAHMSLDHAEIVAERLRKSGMLDENAARFGVVEQLGEVAREQARMAPRTARLEAALLIATGVMRRQMASDEATDAPFNEDMADAIRRAQEALDA